MLNITKIFKHGRSIEDTVEYAKDNYMMYEMSSKSFEYREQRRHFSEELKNLGIPDPASVMDFHLYRIALGGGAIEMGVDYRMNKMWLYPSGGKEVGGLTTQVISDIQAYYGHMESQYAANADVEHAARCV